MLPKDRISEGERLIQHKNPIFLPYSRERWGEETMNLREWSVDYSSTLTV